MDEKIVLHKSAYFPSYMHTMFLGRKIKDFPVYMVPVRLEKICYLKLYLHIKLFSAKCFRTDIFQLFVGLFAPKEIHRDLLFFS